MKYNYCIKTVIFLTFLIITSARQEQDKDKSSTTWANALNLKTAGKVAAGIAAGVGATTAVPAVLGAVGFTTIGIAAKSLAASAHAYIGASVTSGSVFAALQSAGAAGLGVAGNTIIGTVGAAIGYKAADVIVDNTVDEKKK